MYVCIIIYIHTKVNKYEGFKVKKAKKYFEKFFSMNSNSAPFGISLSR